MNLKWSIMMLVNVGFGVANLVFGHPTMFNHIAAAMCFFVGGMSLATALEKRR